MVGLSDGARVNRVREIAEIDCGGVIPSPRRVLGGQSEQSWDQCLY